MLRTLRSPWLPGGVTLNRRGSSSSTSAKGSTSPARRASGAAVTAYGGLNTRPAVEGYWNGHADSISEQTWSRTTEPFRVDGLAPAASRRAGAERRPRSGLATARSWRAAGTPSTCGRWDLLFPARRGKSQPFVAADGVTRHEADMRDGGFLGSTTGAKTTLDFALLAGAMKKGLAVRALCEAKAIERACRRRDRRVATASKRSITGRSTPRLPRRPRAARSRHAEYTPTLLHSRSIGKLTGMPRLGRHFGGNGDSSATGISNDPHTRPDARHAGSRLSPDEGTRSARRRRAWPMIADAGRAPAPKACRSPMWLKRKIDSWVARRSGCGTGCPDGVVGWRHGRVRSSTIPTRSAIFRRSHRRLREDLHGDRQAHSAFSAPAHRSSLMAARVSGKPSRAVW